MIDMATWEERTIDVIDDVLLDSKNVRLVLPSGAGQPQIINDLFHNERVLDLVEAIAKLGYLTHEVPIIIERDGEAVVVEGNRRLAALKAIQNPHLATEFTTRIRRLADSIPNRDGLRRIVVKVAPDQEQANQLIAALHTSNPRFAWTPARQAAFFEAQIAAGRTLADLTVLYPTIDVREFVIRAAVLGLFRDVQYKDPKLTESLHDDRKFPVSTLDRLYKYDEFQKLMGLKIDQNSGTARIAGGKRRFAALAEKVIADVVYKRQNTRTLNRTDSESYARYMKELQEFADGLSDRGADRDNASADGGSRSRANGGEASNSGGDPRGGGVSRASDTGSVANSDSEVEQQPGADGGGSRPRRPRSSPRLDVSGLSIPAGMSKSISSIFVELGDLNIEKYPNASLDLLRTFLEKTIKAYADLLGIDIRSQVQTQGFVFLDHCLKWLLDKATNDNNRAMAQVVRKVSGGQLAAYVATKDHLNAINHNHLIEATPDEVRTAWSAVKPLFEWMLKP